jgi:hypothetical protein
MSAAPDAGADDRAKDLRSYRDLILSKNGPKDATSRLVALGLTRCMDSRTLESFASAEHIAELTALSERTVRTAFKNLVTEGWIKERTKEKGRDFWQKIRRATIPATLRRLDASTGSRSDGLPEQSAGSHIYAQPEADAGSQTTGLAANGGLTGGKIQHGDPAPVAGYLGKRSLLRDLPPRSAVAARQRGSKTTESREARESRIRHYWVQCPQHRADIFTMATLAKVTPEEYREFALIQDPGISKLLKPTAPQ